MNTTVDSPERGMAGGATYDVLVAVTAASSGATLHRSDHRAATIYERFGVRVTCLG